MREMPQPVWGAAEASTAKRSAAASHTRMHFLKLVRIAIIFLVVLVATRLIHRFVRALRIHFVSMMKRHATGADVENQIRINDAAIVNGAGGLVEEINLRTTVLRGSMELFMSFPMAPSNVCPT